MADQGFMAKARRNGYFGTGPQVTQEAEDRQSIFDDQDRRRTEYEKLSEQKLHKIVEGSHQEHKDANGNVPDQE